MKTSCVPRGNDARRRAKSQIGLQSCNAGHGPAVPFASRCWYDRRTLNRVARVRPPPRGCYGGGTRPAPLSDAAVGALRQTRRLTGIGTDANIRLPFSRASPMHAESPRLVGGATESVPRLLMRRRSPFRGVVWSPVQASCNDGVEAKRECRRVSLSCSAMTFATLRGGTETAGAPIAVVSMLRVSVAFRSLGAAPRGGRGKGRAS